MDNKEKVNTIEIEKILISKLDLCNILNEEELLMFFKRFYLFMQHDKQDAEINRKPETISKYLDNYLEFCSLLNLNKKEKVEVIMKFPGIIKMCDQEFKEKYALLSIAENSANTVRIEKFKNSPEDFRCNIKTIYSRYLLMKELHYDRPITWSNLVHASSTEFAKIFVKSKHDKQYKIFDEVEDLTKEKLWAMYPLNQDFIDELYEQEFGTRKEENYGK